MLLTPDGGFNRGSVVGKRVPGTWSRVLDVLVLWTCCVDNVRPSRHTGRAPGGDTIYRDTLPRDGPATPGDRPGGASGGRDPEPARPLENSKETQQ